MAIVVDTSVILAVAANEATKRDLIKITVDTALIAPASLLWEVGNALSAMIKRKRMTADQALAVLAECRRIPVRRIEVPLEESVQLAADFGIYAYDGYMIQCAIMIREPLLTLDMPLRAAARKAGIRVLEVPS
jgi:predicted nucleic acid-binding protein